MQKFIYMFPLLPKGDQIKLIKFFRLKIFSICHRCRWHRWQTLSCKYLGEFSKKIETVLMEYSGAGGKLIHEKNQKQKISWHCPFKSPSTSVSTVSRGHPSSRCRRDQSHFAFNVIQRHGGKILPRLFLFAALHSLQVWITRDSSVTSPWEKADNYIGEGGENSIKK